MHCRVPYLPVPLNYCLVCCPIRHRSYTRFYPDRYKWRSPYIPSPDSCHSRLSRHTCILSSRFPHNTHRYHGRLRRKSCIQNAHRYTCHQTHRYHCRLHSHSLPCHHMMHSSVLLRRHRNHILYRRFPHIAGTAPNRFPHTVGREYIWNLCSPDRSSNTGKQAESRYFVISFKSSSVYFCSTQSCHGQFYLCTILWFYFN